MFTFSFKPIACAMVLSAWLNPGSAQSVPPVPVAKSSEISAFSDYKKFDDPGVTDWRASNDKVRTLGGWRTYLKEAYEAPDETGASASAPAKPGISTTPATPATVPDKSSAGSSSAPSTATSPNHSHHHHGGGK
ncbi:MAG: hypothetical protein QE278_10945 [Limnobacter sp.]|nr:hypothetical protein [Limnobacter sp.]